MPVPETPWPMLIPVALAGMVTVELPVVRLVAVGVAATTGENTKEAAPAAPAALGRMLTTLPETEMTVPVSEPEPALTAVETGMPG